VSAYAVGVAPDYAVDLSVPILDRGRNAKEREIGSSTMCRPNYIKLYTIYIFRDVGCGFSFLKFPKNQALSFWNANINFLLT
jgi:hypothetical protein